MTILLRQHKTDFNGLAIEREINKMVTRQNKVYKIDERMQRFPRERTETKTS